MRFTIACVQFLTAEGDPEKNLSRAERFIKKAADKGADVIVFPEIFLTGPTRDHPELVDKNKKYAKHFCALARQYKIDLAPGSVIEESRGKHYNTAHYIDKNGKTLGTYRKRRLYHREQRHITPGTRQPVFKTRFGTAGLAICWDLAWPDLFRKMAARGATLFYCPSHWWGSDAAQSNRHGHFPPFDALCLARAFETNSILACANAAATWKYPRLSGQSQIVDPEQTLAHARHNKETMILTEVDTKVPQLAEKANHMRRQSLGR